MESTVNVSRLTKRKRTSDPRNIVTSCSRRKQKLDSIREDDDFEFFTANGPIEKNELFEDGDVEGARLFSLTPTTPKNKASFRSPAKKSGSRSAAKVCTPKNKTPSSASKRGRTPSKPTATPKSCKRLDEEFKKTEKVDRKPEIYTPDTRYSLRTRIKKRISKTVLKELELFESEDSGSEYSGDDSEDSDDSSEESSSDEEKCDSGPPIKITIRLPTTPSRRLNKKKLDYVCSAQDYFHVKNLKKKEKTSNNILGKLKNPTLSQTQFRSILARYSPSHKKEIQALHDDLCGHFHKWMFFLSQNFSLILYGLGSKKKILDDFRKEMLSESKVVVVNGFFPALSLKDILDSIMKELLNMKDTSGSSSASVELIKQRLDSLKNPPNIFLIINNIDGFCLRSEKWQSAFSSLASHKKIHLIASIDHVNAPLIWDVAKLGNLNPAWIEATTYLPYTDEVSFENSFLVKHSGSTMALASLIHVYKSLTFNAKRVYRILVEDYLDNAKNKNYPGMSFVKLYRAARNAFIVSSDLPLRSLLTEFLDHELVKWGRDNEHLKIPVELPALRKFMEMCGENTA